MTDPIPSYLEQRIEAGDFPSAVYLVAEKGEIVAHGALGNAVVEPEVIRATTDTIYDVASLTKVLVTCLLTAKLLESSTVRLGDGIGKFLGDTRTDASIQSLVTHTSGLPGWKPFYLMPGAPEFDPEDCGAASGNNDKIRQFIKDEIFRASRAAETDRNVVYSDLNFLLLGFLAEEVAGLDLRNLAGSDIFQRLALKNTSFGVPVGDKYGCAASERGNEYERQTCIELGYLIPSRKQDLRGDPVATAPGSDKAETRDPRFAFRDRMIWGEVHDGNAWFMGGAAGHAGLFSTAEEVFKIALQFLPNYTTLLRRETCEMFRTNYTPGMNEHRSFAFQLASTENSTAGTTMSPQSFGHLGFTGTSLWVDPEKERIFILLTNRTHARPLPFANINGVRRHFHDLAIELLDKH